MPATDDVVYGGHVKFALLDALAAERAARFQRPLPGVVGAAARGVEARRSRAPPRRAFAWNQDGAAYPGWYGDGWELVNEPRARLLHEADHVVLPERVLQARQRTGSTASGKDRGRYSTTRSTRGASSPPIREARR